MQSSSIVAILTVLTLIGFFVRDYYITGLFGLSAKSDIFFMISVVPMFFVSIFCVPFGQASIPVLKKINEYKLQQTISYFFTLSLALCLILCFITYAVYDIFFLVFTSYAFDRDVKLAILSFLPLLFFSGWVILCNSILLAREYYLLPNLAQIVVPLIAVCSTLLFASSIGLYSVIFGMVFGQLINLIIIRSVLIKEKIFFRTITFEMPSMIKKKFWIGYGYLVIIAAFTSINIPLSTFVASALGDGAVSIFNLGIKFNLFFCGLFTAVFSSVV